MKRLLAALLTGVLTCGLVACGSDTGSSDSGSGEDSGKTRIVIMPKVVGIDYYNAVEVGVKEATEELADTAEIEWTGPTEATADAQIEMLSSIIATKPDAICVAVNDTEALVPTLQQAKEAGINEI